jgi:predicted NodU family carbamoyl transferase
MIVWGISANSHDASLAVFNRELDNLDLVFASHSERFSGIKNDSHLSQEMVSYAVIDSIGEFETMTIWEAAGTTLKKKFSQRYPHSIGLWYSAMTDRVGLKANEDEYILMGMAAYGNPLKHYWDITGDFFESFGSEYDTKIKFSKNLHQGCRDWRPDLRSQQDFFNIAAATQEVYEALLTNQRT